MAQAHQNKVQELLLKTDALQKMADMATSADDLKEFKTSLCYKLQDCGLLRSPSSSIEPPSAELDSKAFLESLMTKLK